MWGRIARRCSSFLAEARPLYGTRALSAQAANEVDVLVVGAGVVGLAAARAIAGTGRDVLVVDAHPAVGMETSSRSSEVIHAGIYYPRGSLKAQLCVEGKERLYTFCKSRGVPHKRIGKLLVATQDAQLPKLQQLEQSAIANGVTDLSWVSVTKARELEPHVAATAALLSPSSGIVDSHALMQALHADIEEAGGTVALSTRVVGGAVQDDGRFLLELQSTAAGASEAFSVSARAFVNAAGLHATKLASSIQGIPKQSIPELHLARGVYFTLSGPSPFSRLVYPLPEDGGLGIHATVDMGGACRFGPDVEWVSAVDYSVDPNRAACFEKLIRSYWPGLPKGALQPGYAGVRPKLSGPGQPGADFLLQGAEEHGVARLVNLYGIESPGLTASLAIADRVARMLQEQQS